MIYRSEPVLVNVGNVFVSLIEELARRVKIEQQMDLFAVIIDGETVTWGVSDDAACRLAIALIEAGY